MRSCTRSLIYWGFPFLTPSSAACSAQLECDSIETRKAILELVSSDSQNPLVDYAVKNSNSNSSAGDSKKLDKKPLYEFGQRMVTTSASKDKSTLKCSGAISVAVGDIKATKEINYTVQRSSGGTLSVSIEPFQF